MSIEHMEPLCSSVQDTAGCIAFQPGSVWFADRSVAKYRVNGKEWLLLCL